MIKDDLTELENIQLLDSFTHDLLNTANSILNNYQPSEKIMRLAVCRAIDHKNYYFLESIFDKHPEFRFDIYEENFYLLSKLLSSSDLCFLDNIFKYFKFNQKQTTKFIYDLFDNWQFLIRKSYINNLIKSDIKNTIPENLMTILKQSNIESILNDFSQIQRIKNF